MPAYYDVPAPAKLNLFLHITGRRADGYHLLQSVFMLIDWQDRLDFFLRSDGQIRRIDDSSDTLLPADDLCVRAARLLQQSTGCTLGADIVLHKHIPAQAGMGGGSSDAATTLMALNRLWKLDLRRHELQALGLRLGADVPFFIGGHNAWVEGIGEQITPLTGAAALPRQRFVVIKPAAGTDTAQIFSSDLLERATKPAIVTDFAAQHFFFGRNDMQRAATAQCPEIQKVIDFLKSRKICARMTGSGSTVFAPIAHDENFSDANAKWKIKTCYNLGIHPVAHWVRD